MIRTTRLAIPWGSTTLDRLWRVADHPDVVVCFDDALLHLVFWRGTSYIPAWVGSTGMWVSDQGPEIFVGGHGCFESMSDKQCRFSHVRIIENTAARSVIHAPGTRPQDNIEPDAITVADLNGATNTYSWARFTLSGMSCERDSSWFVICTE